MDKHVVHSRHRPALKRASDHPLRWAIDKATGEAVFVGTLAPDRNGNACGCKCPACNEDLQAVNADKPPEHFEKQNTRWKFFRHPSGHHRAGCSFLMAKLAALQLLMERGEIDLPAPRKRGLMQGISGTLYSAEAEGQRWRGKVVNRVWLDSQAAKITLDDGRTVLVDLRTRMEASSVSGIDGVLTIHVDDPEVASWSPEQIMAALQLDGKTACWEAHWDDALLAAEADRLARESALNSLDTLPQELAHLADLTQAQKIETVLHAKVKEILAGAGGMKAPSIEQEVTRIMVDGTRRSKIASYPSQHLQFSEVRLEMPFLDMVPDVMCRARSSRNTSERFDLLIEVAVTHKVDARKRNKIVAAGMPCIEIDLTKLGGVKRTIKVDELRAAVLEESIGKDWVFNPWLQRQIEAYDSDLAAQDKALRDQEEEENERMDWLNEKSLDSLLEMWLTVLRHRWRYAGPAVIEDGYRVWPEEISRVLATRGFHEAEDEILTRPSGILYYLDEIAQAHHDGYSMDSFGTLWSVINERSLNSFITLMLIALRVYRPMLTSDEQLRVNELRGSVFQSLKNLNTVFARPAIYDNLIIRIFPAMAEQLRHPLGTLAEVQRQIHSKRMLEEAQAKEAQRQRNEKAAQAWKLEKEKADEKLARRERQEMAIAAVIHELRQDWSMEKINSLDYILNQPAVIKVVRNYARSEMDVIAILTSAWTARSRGMSIYHWFQRQSVEETHKAKMIVHALKTSGLLARSTVSLTAP